MELPSAERNVGGGGIGRPTVRVMTENDVVVGGPTPQPPTTVTTTAPPIRVRSLQVFQQPCHRAITEWYNSEATQQEKLLFRQVTRGIIDAKAHLHQPLMTIDPNRPTEGKYAVWADALMHPNYRDAFFQWLSKTSPAQIHQFHHLISTLCGRLHIHHITCPPPPPKIISNRRQMAATFRSSIKIGLDTNIPLPPPSRENDPSKPKKRAQSAPFPRPISKDQFQPPPVELVLNQLLTLKSRNKRRGDFTGIPYARLSNGFVEKLVPTTAEAFPRPSSAECRDTLPNLDIHARIFHARPVRGPLP